MKKECIICGKKMGFFDSGRFIDGICDECVKKRPEEVQRLVAERTGTESNTRGSAAVEDTTEFKVQHSYRTLLGYGKLTSSIGWLVTALSVIAVVGGLIAALSKGEDIGYIAVIGGIIVAILGFGMVISGQVISCFISIERNTRATYEALSQKQSNENEEG